MAHAKATLQAVIQTAVLSGQREGLTRRSAVLEPSHPAPAIPFLNFNFLIYTSLCFPNSINERM